ncbi:26S proteasome non-ATPase regulatory subunit 8-like [Coturnix japonica]|nr:26S proteasome non-ATPase regulatory subunit 8-like [Coturnix japonica]
MGLAMGLAMGLIVCYGSLQYLMEGSYNRVFLAKGNIPAESYNFFIDILLDTIRDEIAGCMECAYEQIQVQGANRILFFNSAKRMNEYGRKVREQLPHSCPIVTP